MNVVSAYLIRQVAEEQGSDADDICSAMKSARNANDPTQYIKTRYVKLGNSYVPVWENYNGYNTEEKDYAPSMIQDETYIYHGCARMKAGVDGLAYCLYKQEMTPLTAIEYFAASGTGDLWCDRRDESVSTGDITETHGNCYLIANTGESYGITYYETHITKNVPVFDTMALANEYATRVSTYWDSGEDIDLEDLRAFLESYMG